ncbi:Twin-arginine translocation pathway signal [Embleya sp. NPDC005575]|uniref:Twin-arginine translocation pathway signal n=1 Tax=Embleya sp. NPDC005575 TaxID=3156892 RepID=UPI0033A83FB4
MSRPTRARREQIRREAATIRARCEREGRPVEEIADTIGERIPELSALEGWRLALGWTRAQTLVIVARIYADDGLRVPGLSAEQLCRFEHGPDRPGPEYAQVLARAYGTTEHRLGLATRCACGRDETRLPTGGLGYGRARETHVGWATTHWGVEHVTTAAGLPAVRESLHRALTDDPRASRALAEAAVEPYALNYSRHPPQVLFGELHRVRGMLAPVLEHAAGGGDDVAAAGLRSVAARLTALLGNLAFHLGDHTGAQAHLAAAALLGERCGADDLRAWTFGAASMVARVDRRHEAALAHAEHGLALAGTALRRAQLSSWALAPSLAALGRSEDARRAVIDADDALDAAPAQAPGRFGFNHAEHLLHTAETHIALGQGDRAGVHAHASIAAAVHASPGWAAAAAVLALAEAPTTPGDAAARAHDLLDRVPAHHLRATTRERLERLAPSLPREVPAGAELPGTHRGVAPGRRHPRTALAAVRIDRRLPPALIYAALRHRR